jgi:hypothetical protein
MALFAYIGALAVQCKERKQEEILEQIGSWIDSLIKQQLSTWVQHQPRQWVSSFTVQVITVLLRVTHGE